MFEDDQLTLGEWGDYASKEAGKPSELLITNDFVGTEVELEQANHLSELLGRSKLWSRHEDGSLRNNGHEFIFRRPMCGLNVVEAYRQLEDAAKTAGTIGVSPHASIRTSVHTHVDVCDLTAEEIAAMILTYMIFEKPFFKTFGPTRIDSHFCIPYNEVMDLVSAPRWLKEGFDSFEKNVNGPNIGRYCAFNLKSIFKFGTIEFRHHPGEWAADKLLLWTNACLAFKRAARIRINFKKEYFENSEQGFEGRMRNIFPFNVTQSIIQAYKGDMQTLNRDIIHGIRAAQSSTLPRLRIN